MATKFKKLELLTLLLCFVLNMLDGMDVLVVSYTAPVFSKEWTIAPSTLGVIFSAGLAGMTLGALFIAPYADKFGRKSMILLATLTIGFGMILSGFAQNVTQFALLRFFTGLGIGAMLASVTALVSEFAPEKYRNMAVTIAIAGYPLGAVTAGILAAFLIPSFGWQSLFLVAGCLSLLMFPVCLWLLPESVSLLIARQPRNALVRVNRVLVRLGEDPRSVLPEIAAGKSKGANFVTLLKGDYRKVTILNFFSFFFAFMTLYFLTSWIPQIASDAGLPVEQSIYAGATFNIGAFVGLMFLGWVSTSAALGKTIFKFFFFAASLMVVFSILHSPLPLFFVEIFLLGLLIQGGFGGMYAMAARSYPPEIRTTGVGFALGAGRFGAVFGPYLAGIIIALGGGLLGSFLIFSIPTMLAGLIVKWLDNENEKKGASI